MKKGSKLSDTHKKLIRKKDSPKSVNFGELIPSVKKVEDWHRMSKCPVCGSDIDSGGKKYACKRCEFSIEKPKCEDCGSIRMFVRNWVRKEEVNFGCIDCGSGFKLKL